MIYKSNSSRNEVTAKAMATQSSKQSTSDRLKLLDQYIHALVERFYLRLPLDGATLDLNGSELFALSLLGRKGRSSMTELAEECTLALSS